MSWRILTITLVGCLITIADQNSDVCQVSRPIQFELNILKLEGAVLKSSMFMERRNGSSTKADSTFDNSSFPSAVQVMRLNPHTVIEVEDGAFSQFICLNVLTLSCNLIESISSKTFDHLTELKLLNLTVNKIVNISVHAFSQLKSLKSLDLSFNSISVLNQLHFAQNTELEYLSLSHNSIRALGDYFSSLIQLKELLLDHCAIAIFRTQWMKNITALQKLDLSGNEIILIYFELFSFNKTSMQLLNLSNNCLTSKRMKFHIIALEFSNSKAVIDLNTNHFDCASWPEDLSDFKANNVTLAPLRNDTGKRKVKGWTCFNEDLPTNNVLFSSLIVVGVIMVLMVVVLFAVDYRAKLGYRQKIIDKVRKWFSGKLPQTDGSYSHLHVDF